MTTATRAPFPQEVRHDAAHRLLAREKEVAVAAEPKAAALHLADQCQRVVRERTSHELPAA